MAHGRYDLTEFKKVECDQAAFAEGGALRGSMTGAC